MSSPSSSAPIPEQSHEELRAELTIRFTTALPDLVIKIPDVSSASVPWLKHQIRANRPEDTGHKKLRLIYAGRVLVSGDGKTLMDQMRFVRPPPVVNTRSMANKGKG